MPEHPHVVLGGQRLPVYPQPPKRITKRLGRIMDSLDVQPGEDGELDREAFVGSLGDRVYYVLATFVPNMPQYLPEWKFWGYRSVEAFEADDFDEDEVAVTEAPNANGGPVPSVFPEWLAAFDVIVDVNGGKRFLELLGKVVPGDWIKVKFAELFEAGQDRLSGSPNSPSTKDGSDTQKSSGTTPPMSEPPGDSPASEAA